MGAFVVVYGFTLAHAFVHQESFLKHTSVDWDGESILLCSSSSSDLSLDDDQVKLASLPMVKAP